MIILFAFLSTAVYSLSQILFEQNIRLEDFQLNFEENTMRLSTPVYINNTSYYDIDEFIITSEIKDTDGWIITSNSTNLNKIEKGTDKQANHEISLNLTGLILDNIQLLFNNSSLNVHLQIGLKYAYALEFIIETNTTIPWGAPLNNLNFTDYSPPSFNGTHLIVNFTIELENNSFFEISGDLNIGVYNELGEYVGSGKKTIIVPPGSELRDPTEIAIQLDEPLKYTGSGNIVVNFELLQTGYAFEIGRIPYG
jgi:hypothetical protein